MKNNNQPKQVSLAGVAQNKGDKQPKRKNRFLFWLIPLAVVVLAIGGTTLHKQLTKGPSLTAREMVNYTVTEDALTGKVSYFALGVLGEEATDPMDMVAVMCLDRKKNTVSVIQMPVATYLGKESGFATSVIGEVWGNPQPVVWCDTCRCAVKAKDVDGDKHKPCGTKLTTRKGSAFGDLCRVFNVQYGLPIDNYLVIPREGLIGLIDAVGGLDVQLDKDMTLADVPYKKGVQLLSGKAAVDYAMQHEYKNTPATDRTRMTRQRAVISALLQRLARFKVNELYYVDKNTGASKGPIGQLMVGTDPMRFDTSSFGKARLLNCSEMAAADKKTSRALAEFVSDIAKLSQEKITFSILPGESVKQGTSSVWSVNRAQVIRLLNEQMNPYGLTLDEKTVTAPQVKDKAAQSDASTISLDKVAVTQGTTTTTVTTTTTTAATTVATTRRLNMVTGQDIWHRAVHVLDKHKAVGLRVLQVGHVTAITDYFLLATGGSATQLRSLSDYLERELGQEGIRPLRQDGYQTGDWITMDYGDVIVHLFRAETREFYDLERLWTDAAEVDITPYLVKENEQ